METYREFAAEVLGPITKLPVLELPITAALGCCAAETVGAPQPVPAFRQALADGIALLAQDAAGASPDTPVILPVGSTVVPGTRAEPVAPGHCARIALGAELPPNTDALVRTADCQLEPDKVVLTRPPVPGASVRGVGSTFGAGDTVVEAGQRLSHIAIAELALVGLPRVLVHPRPRVVVVAIGSEFVRAGQPAGEVSVHDAAAVLLATTAARLGADCFRVGPVPDDPRAVRDTIEDQLVRADVIVTIGGIEHEHDVLREELAGAGLARFDGPALEPVGAYGVGRIGPDQIPILALPGEPVEALLAFHALARPVIAGMLGEDVAGPARTVPAPRSVESGSVLVPGSLDGDDFRGLAGDVLALPALAGVTCMAVCHAGAADAEVVPWPS